MHFRTKTEALSTCLFNIPMLLFFIAAIEWNTNLATFYRKKTFSRCRKLSQGIECIRISGTVGR